MGERWTDYEIQRDFTDWRDLCDAHNADCDAYEKRIAELEALVRRVKAESLRVVPVGSECKLSELEELDIKDHTNTCTIEGADWRVYAAERRVDDRGHRYLMPVSDEWPPIAFGPDTKVKPVRLERWETEE